MLIAALCALSARAEERGGARLANVGTLIFAGHNDEAKLRIHAAMAFYESAHDRRHQAICSLLLGIVEVRLAQITEARTHLDETGQRFEELHDYLGVWFTSWTLGELERGQGNFDASLAYHERAVLLLRNSKLLFSINGLIDLAPVFGLPAENLRALLGQEAIIKVLCEVLSRSAYGRALVEAGRLEQAEVELTRARAISARFGGLLDSLIDAPMGDLRKRQGRYDEARVFYRKALYGTGLFPAVGFRDEWVSVDILDRLSELEVLSGHCDAAMDWSAQAVRTLRAAHNSARLASELHDQAELLQRCNRLDEATRVLDEALTLARQSGDALAEAMVRATAAGVSVSRGQYGSAARECEQAIDSMRSLDRADLAAQLWLLRAVIHLHTGEIEAAGVAAGKATALAQKSVSPMGIALASLVEAVQQHAAGHGNPGVLRDAFLRLATLQEGGSLPPEVRQIVGAMMGLEPAPDPEHIRTAGGVRALAFLLYGKIDFDLGRYKSARAQWRKGLEENPNRDLKALFLMLIGIAWRQQGDDPRAIQSIMDAANAVEQTIEDLQADEMLAGYLGSYRHIYLDVTVDWLVSQGRVEEAFDYTERARARGFLSAVTKRREAPRERADEPLLREVETLSSEIASAERRRVVAAVIDRPAIDAQLRGLHARYGALFTRMKAAAAGSPSLARVETLAMEEVQAALPAGTSLISYFAGARGIHVWVLDSGSAQHLLLPVTPTALQRAVCWAKGFGKSGSARSGRPFDAECDNTQRATSEDVFSMLFGPLRRRIRNRRLIVVPHRVLHYIPFAALRNPSTGRYLIQDYSLTYAPSASALRVLLRQKSPFEGRALVLGAPDTANWNLPELHGMESEAADVAEIFGTKPWLAGDATEDLLYGLNGGIDVIHIAAHGQYNAEDPLYSRIALAPSNTRDGNLEVHEILDDIDLAGVNLIVLSSCQTARGRGGDGDDVTGITQALLYAGAADVISAQWDVADEATTVLMHEFYCRLKSGDSAAEALRGAQLSMLSSRPYENSEFWGAFMVSGNPPD